MIVVGAPGMRNGAREGGRDRTEQVGQSNWAMLRADGEVSGGGCRDRFGDVVVVDVDEIVGDIDDRVGTDPRLDRPEEHSQDVPNSEARLHPSTHPGPGKDVPCRGDPVCWGRDERVEQVGGQVDE